MTVGLPRWRDAREDLLARASPLGVRLANTDPVDALAVDLGRLALVVLHFPKFTDGRAYGQARRLRAFHKYAGEVRATGNVLRDQLALMVRTGFDAFVIDAPDAAERYRAAVAAITHVYQPRRAVVGGG
ncbi:MAG: DUF934 domain-containing protein [Alphaproteobacteria bacterium]|nr:DUF934 domain-containing protein [Alphaproteobacteria bacterium]